jgi:SAM-dependent methyltransferase
MRFRFGKNWQSYSKKALTPERVEAAREQFRTLLDQVELKGQRFLDIGFGQGLSLSCAAKEGTLAKGVDVDQDNLDAFANTKKIVGIEGELPVEIGSILDEAWVKTEQEQGLYDIVHSWGVLHHTGDMHLAFKHACALVKDDGHFVCAIYNRHWSSLSWKWIKWTYCASPAPLQQLMIAIFTPIIYVAKWMVTGKNPTDKLRGMDFMHDIVDWVGGYPYEYASIEEIKTMVAPYGFTCIKEIEANVPTGCNEMVFVKSSPTA